MGSAWPGPVVLTFLLAAALPLSAEAQDTQPTPPFPAELTSFRPVQNTPVFAGRGDGHWDARIRERGWILREHDRYRMWYTGYDGSRDGLRRLGYATSPDGLTWQRRPQPLLNDLWVEDMMVVPHQGRYLMFAEGARDQAQLLSSPDGLRWKREGPLDVRLRSGQRVPPGPLGTPTVFVHDTVFHLFYERRDAGVWLATSKDLKVWTNVSDEPVLSPGPHEYDQRMIALNQIIRHGDWFYAYYHGTGTPAKPRKWCTGLAASRDLVHWIKYPQNPLLPVAANKSSGIVIGDGPDRRLFTMHDRVDVHRLVPQK